MCAPRVTRHTSTRLAHSFNVVIKHTRSTRTLAFTQASSFHKLSVPPSYVIPVWCVFSKPCTKLALNCNHRSGHLKTEHTESLFLLWRHLGNWAGGPAVSMKSELLVTHAKLGQLRLRACTFCPCKVRNKFLVNFWICTNHCKRTVYHNWSFTSLINYLLYLRIVRALLV
jgi:hypothetical protein